MLPKLRTPIAALAAALSVAVAVAPASARTSYVQDGAGLFNSDTISTINQKVGDFNRQTGKEVLVVTVPSLDGSTAEDAAEKTFATQQVNGVLIFLAKAERKDGLIPDRASAPFFPSGSLDAVRQAMRGYFRSGDYDTGIVTGVNLVLNTYRSHESSLRSGRSQSYVPSSSTRSSSMGGGMSLIWLILILVAGFLVIRAIFRAMMGPRMMPPGYGGPGYGGPGYGGPGYGGMGYGGGMGGGGSFFSGLLGGLGGAWLGNELFNNHNGGGNFVQSSGFDPGSQVDAGGWQSDPGQADMGNSSFGDFGGGGGGGDFGGGFGGGDSGGGW